MAVSRTSHQGFTLIELMVTIAIAAILLTIGVPSLTSFFDRQKVVAAAEAVYNDISLARSMAIDRNKNIYFKASLSGTTMYTGFTDLSSCAPETLNSCTIYEDTAGDGNDASDKVTYSFKYDDFTDVTITLSDSYVSFDSIRGTADVPDDFEIEFSLNSYNLNLTTNAFGKPTICSDGSSVGGYKSC